ncbi:MAG: sensor histidine kinase [Candidatus Xenobiia bacterium LiM19]
MEHRSISEISYQFLCEEAPVLFLLFNRQGIVIEMNAYARKIFGEMREACAFGDLFIDFRGLLHFADCASDPSKSHLLNISAPDGLPRTFHVRFHDLGECIMALGRQDIQEFETLQKEILSLNGDLSNLTRELHQSNAELKNLNILKNQFLGMAAHDLRTPIHHIKLCCEFLLDEADSFNDDQREFLSTIHSSSRYMLALVEDFLDLSIIESGQLRISKAPTELEPLINQASKLIEARARKKKVAIELSHDSTIPMLLVDVQKIEQVLVNLIGNGVDYSPPDSTVRVETRKERANVTVSVTDEGEGIPADELGRLFSPYTKGKAKKTGNEKSAGLGLVISKKIVEAHGGTIQVTSTPGSGSTFTFCLPS